MRPAQDLSLAADLAWKELVNVGATSCVKIRVKPGSIVDSYLINKLTGQGMCNGTLMPKADSALSNSQIDLIRSWICQGATNN
jgi:hypothetical protein